MDAIIVGHFQEFRTWSTFPSRWNRKCPHWMLNPVAMVTPVLTSWLNVDIYATHSSHQKTTKSNNNIKHSSVELVVVVEGGGKMEGGGRGIGTVSIQHHQSSFQSMISCWCFSVLHLNTTHREEGFNISVGHFPATSFCPLTALSTSRNVNWPNTIRSIPDRLWAFEQNQNHDLLFQLATDWWFQLAYTKEATSKQQWRYWRSRVELVAF